MPCLFVAFPFILLNLIIPRSELRVPLNGESKGGEHPFWSRARVNTPHAKCLVHLKFTSSISLLERRWLLHLCLYSSPRLRSRSKYGFRWRQTNVPWQ